jgi:hypothetical protein
MRLSESAQMSPLIRGVIDGAHMICHQTHWMNSARHDAQVMAKITGLA